MKRRILILMVLCAIAMNNSYAQTTPSASEQLPPFSTIVPQLELLKTGYPSLKAGNTEPIKYSKDIKSGIHRFIGQKITTDFIREKIGMHMVKTRLEKGSYDDLRLKKLIIYCDTLEMKELLWLPEADIDIQTRVLLTNKNWIKSSALDWRDSTNYDAITDNGKAGQPGGNAGNISIRYMISDIDLTSGIYPVEAKGGAGETIFVPKVNIKYPESQNSVDVHMAEGCEGYEVSKQYTTIYAKADRKLIGLVTYNQRGAARSNCLGYKSFDPDIEFVEKSGWRTKIRDKIELDRLTFGGAIVPGKGGNSGKINCVAPNMTTRQDMIKGASPGIYVARQNENGITYGTIRKPIEEIKINVTVHYMALLEVMWNPTPFINKLDIYDKDDEGGNHNTLYVPSYSAIYFLNSKIKAAGTQPSGNDGMFSKEKKPYFPHPEYLQKCLTDLQAQHFIYFKKSPEEKRALNQEVDKLVASLSVLNKDDNVDLEKRADYASLYQSAIELSHYRNRNVDEFNNVVGYRPSLSLTSTMQYINNKEDGKETRLEKDMRLYILSDMMASQEANTNEFLAKIPTMVADLQTINATLYEDLKSQNKAYEAIAVKALACDRQIDTVRKDLEAVERRTLEKFKSDQADQALWRGIFKIAAVGVSILPVGQPALGQLAGNGLSAIADQIGTDDDLGTSVGKVMSTIDFSSVMKGLANSSKAIAPNPSDKIMGADGQEVDKYAGYKLPSANERYQKDLKKYNKEQDTRNKTISEAGNRGLGITSSYLKYSVSQSEVDAKLAEFRARSVDFQNVSDKISVLNKQKAEIFSDLQNAIQGTIGIEAKIMQNEATIFKLVRHQNDNVYSPELEEAFTDVKAAAAKRLKWVEYQLIKAYEYTTLKPYTQNNSAFDIFIQKYEKNKEKITIANLDTNIDTLKVVYDNQRAEMGIDIGGDPSLASYKTDDKYSRSIILASEKAKGVLSNNLLDELNQKGRVTIDLQSDFGSLIIRPDEENTKIQGIKLVDLQFKGTLTSTVKITLEILDGGILRKENNLFLFKTGNPSGVANSWTWTVANKNNKLEISGSSFSQEHQQMIDFLTGSKSNDKVSSFTSPPAWSRCRLTIQNIGTGDVPDLSYIEFGLRATSKESETLGKVVVLDIKTENAPLGTVYTLTEGNNKAKESDKHISNYYGIHQKEKTINLQLLPEPEGATSKFKHWIIYDVSNKRGDILIEKNITRKIDENTRIIAIFKDVNQLELATPTAKQKITLYEGASESSKIIAVEADDDLIVPIPEKEPVKGFKRVAYRGMQEAYIKKE
jgi:hypothetical protein